MTWYLIDNQLYLMHDPVYCYLLASVSLQGGSVHLTCI